MSDKKKVIYVKDLVIKADNVRIEPTRRQDPFFGPRAIEEEEQVEEEILEEKEEEEGSEEDKDDRPPFSWI
ncbi:hypothetical protein [Gracilibacillus kekensis]|uniref:Uncharacterized protein n=1 Tax=Gracilibacillus kekensis TaxID=1027249 RepID=A0A1M7IJ78_9BACI|nr:hypothetical protein [Gracilibacillus kekensis]SHM40882.1 hypothetical protein SAMN05216179_0074 [Gracilibacillus kekensis]